jgi:hypothetical protein
MLFLSEFLVIFSFVLAYKFNAKVRESEFVDGIKAFAACLLGPGGGIPKCGAHPTARPPLSLWHGVHFGLAGQGIINFAVYGTQRNNYTLWLNFFFAGLGFSQKGSRADDGSTLDSTNGAGRGSSKRAPAAAGSAQGATPQSDRKAGVEMRNGGAGGANNSQRDLLTRQGSAHGSSASALQASPRDGGAAPSSPAAGAGAVGVVGVARVSAVHQPSSVDLNRSPQANATAERQKREQRAHTHTHA